MNSFIIARYRLKMLFHSTKNIITLFIFPLILIYIIGYIYSPQTIKQIPIALVDEDMSEYSQRLISLVKENEVLHVLEIGEEEARDLIRKNEIEGAYIIKTGFEELIKKDTHPKIVVLKSAASLGATGISDIIVGGVVRLQSNARAANIVVNEYARRNILKYYNSSVLWQEVFDRSESYWYPEQLMKLQHRHINNEHEIYNAGTGLVQLSSGPIGVIVMYLAISLGYVFSMIIKDKRENTLKRLFLISNGNTDSVLGYIYSMVILLLVQSFFLILITNKLFKISFGISNGLLLSIIFIYCIYISTIVLALAIGSHSHNPWNSYYTLAVIITSIIGGSFWSIELLSIPLQRLALLTPQGLVIYIISLAKQGNILMMMVYSMLMIVLSVIMFVYSKRRLRLLITENIE